MNNDTTPYSVLIGALAFVVGMCIGGIVVCAILLNFGANYRDCTNIELICVVIGFASAWTITGLIEQEDSDTDNT